MKRFCVRDLRGPFDERTFASLAPDARIQWRQPLVASDLARAVDWLGSHPHASLRLYSNACEQLGTLAAGPFLPMRLALDGIRLPATLPPLPGVHDLTLESPPGDVASLLAAVPALKILQADFRGATLNAAALAGVAFLARWSLAKGQLSGGSASQSLPALRAIELRDVTIERVDDVLRVPGLRALRLCGIPGLRSIDALAGHGNLRVLALESLTHLEDLHVLATLPRLESLDLAGLWQFSLGEVAFITSMRGLRRLAIDIGGRRKNVEIYRKMQLPKPPPFDIRGVPTI